MSHVYSVTQLNQEIKGLLESNPTFRNVFVQGEISNYKQHTSGHHYMTLKDEGGAINAVMFRGDAARLRFRLQNGMKVIARGRVSSFPKTGQVQLYMADLMPDGAGALHMAFEQLKSRLYMEGLFAQEHKKEIPQMPETIALITSPTGAAVRDMIRILGRRWPLAKIEVWPVLVQGARAPADIAQTIALANVYGSADVIIVGRGGGSLEDLWAFNEEIVARAIYDSKIPVISAVGHEPDVTIADFVADLRAPTPSGAAELAVPDMAEFQITLDRIEERLFGAMQRQLRLRRNQLHASAERLERCTPVRYFAERHQSVMDLTTRLILAQKHNMSAVRTKLEYQKKRLDQAGRLRMKKEQANLQTLTGRLDALSPLKVLARGFSVTTDAAGTVITDSTVLQSGDILFLRFARGGAKVRVQSVEKSRK